MKFLARKTLSGLAPIDEAGAAVLKKLSVGDVVMTEVMKPRNIQFHRKFFAMLKLILQNQETYSSIDDLLDVCKLRVGHVKTIHTRHGMVRLPKSISFANMDETQFQFFYDRCVDWVLTEVIPALSRDDLEREVEEALKRFAD